MKKECERIKEIQSNNHKRDAEMIRVEMEKIRVDTEKLRSEYDAKLKGKEDLISQFEAQIASMKKEIKKL